MPSGGSRCAATGRDESVPFINSKVPAWIPPSAIKREALHNNTDSDDEELFRKVRGLLNKLTPEKFEKLSVEFCNLSIKNPKALKGIIVLILDKALTESAYSALYAQLCQRLDKWVPNFEPPNLNNPQNSITTFKKLLLTVCQHEFDNRSNYTSNLLSISNDISSKTSLNPSIQQNFSDDEKKAQLELARQNAKKKMLGNVKFIGELGRLDLLSEAILHKCIKTLLEKQRDEKYSDMSEDLECLCKMMPTIGKKLDQGEAIKLMDQYFERMKKLCGIRAPNKTEYALPMRIRFLLQDLIDLRANQWQPRKTQMDQAPKTMHEVRNGAFIEEMQAASLAASARDAQEAAAAQACFNISSLNITSNSALMLNMYQKLSQQPNVSLLNAINTKIATNKNNNLALQQQKTKEVYTNEYLATNTDVKPVENTVKSQSGGLPAQKTMSNNTSNSSGSNELNLARRQNTTKQSFIKQLAPDQSDQPLNVNPQKTNFPFQRGSQRQNFNTSSATDQQKLQHKNKGFLNKNQLIDQQQSNTTQDQSKNYFHHSHHPNNKPTKKPASQMNFNWNQLHPSTQSSQPPAESTNLQILQIKTQNNMQSISSSSSPFSSTSSLSASPPLPCQDNNTKEGTNYVSSTNSTNQNDQLVSSNTSKPVEVNQQDSNYNLNINTQNRSSYNNSYNNRNMTNNNGYNNNKRQGYSGGQQRTSFYSNSNQNMARNALGVSTNDVLPLNKPIIPLDKITKYDHHGHNNKQQQKPKVPLNIFNTNIYNFTPQQQNVTNSQKKQNNQILDETLKKRLLTIVDKFLSENEKNEENSLEYEQEIMKECLNDIKAMKLTNEKLSESIRALITHSLSKSDADRLNISHLFVGLHALETDSGMVLMNTETFINGLKMILQNLSNLESEYHFVKSNISLFCARAVCNSILTFDDLGSMMRHGNHYPLFFLCMQNMHKLKTKEWLRTQLEKSKICLIEMLPQSDRHKDRLIQILEDRELSFVYPMLKIESSLYEKIQSSSLTNDELKKWIEANVSKNVTNSNDFIHSLVTCIVKNAAENSVLSTENSDLNSKMDKNHVNKQKKIIHKYQTILQEYLCATGVPKSKKLNKQIEAIYAMQVYANSKGFPKYFLAHLFNQMYDLEIIEEEAFLQWKDEINENYPNKGQALFHLQRWFNWLQEASEESSSSETEGLVGEKLHKQPNGTKPENKDQIEV